MKKVIFFSIVSASLFQFCHSSKKIAIAKSAHSPITYLGNVRPLMQDNCTPCHFPPKGFKKALDTYPSASANIDEMIRRINLNSTDKGFMPFKHAKLNDSIIHVFEQWKKDGLPEK